MLLEREEVLARLARFLDEAVTGRGRLVLVGGEAGIGKTTVVRATARAAANRVEVGVGQCDDVGASAALEPLVDALPDVADLVEQDMERTALFRRLLARLGREPTLLVLEDLHWADEATLDFLRFLGRRVEQLPLLVLATYRDDEVGPTHHLAAVMGDLSSSASVRRIGVTPLSVDAVRRLVTDAASPLDPVVLHERTGGNAFYVTEVLAAAGEQVPVSVRDAVLARAARLSADGRRVLAAAAVLGQPADLSLLTAVAGRDGTAVDECVAAGLLVGDGRTWGFRHDLARLSVDGTLLPTERSELHAAALAALAAAGGAGDHRLAHHADGCGDTDAVRRHAVPAAERSARLGAHHEAADLLRLALRYHPAPDHERSRLCAALSYECYLTDQLREAFDARHESMELTEDPREVGDAERWLSRICWYLGRGEAAQSWMQRAVRTLEAVGDGPELAMAYSNRAQLCMLAYDAPGAVEWGTRALEVARRVGDGDTEIHALNNMGTALSLADDYLKGMSLLERSRDLALAADAHEHVARAYTNLGASAVTTRHLDAGERHLRAGIAYCQERDLDSWVHYMRAWLPRVSAERGQPERAQELALELLALPDLPPIVRVPALATVVQVTLRRGEDAKAWLSEAIELAGATQEAQRLVPVAVSQAEQAWLEGRPSDVLAAVDLAWTASTEHPLAWVLGELAWWLSVGGERRALPLPPPEPFRLMLENEWHAAADAWRALGIPYWEALALARAADLDSARQALEIVDRLGASAARAAIVRDRHAAGLPVPRGPRAAPGSSPAGLTARELDVLVLLGDGLSDAGIAEALVLSRKTVGHHVSAVLRKLDAPSRSRAVAAAARLGILGPGRPDGDEA